LHTLLKGELRIAKRGAIDTHQFIEAPLSLDDQLYILPIARGWIMFVQWNVSCNHILMSLLLEFINQKLVDCLLFERGQLWRFLFKHQSRDSKLPRVIKEITAYNPFVKTLKKFLLEKCYYSVKEFDEEIWQS